MHPLVWLALPVLVTALAAVVLVLRDRRPAPDRDQELQRISRALGGDE